MQRMTIDFGIDLGTTNSTVAVIDGTDAREIPNKAGSPITPSAVWEDKRGNIHVGQEAKLRALGDDPENADVEFKLRMGLGEAAARRFERSGRMLLPEELSAEVLKSLRTDVRSNMGEELDAAVITVPAAFENPSTNATMKAAKLAGFTTSPLLLEPVAASLAYGFQSESENVYWFVYDFGGGTFDAAVMRIRDGLFQVVNHDGDNFLGGKLVDWDIVTKKLVPALTAGFNLPDFTRGNQRWRGSISQLKWHAEQAKIEVCRTRAPFEIWIEGLCEDADAKEVDFAYTLTPAEVEEVCQPYIEKSLGLCRRTLEGARLNGSDMERILLVGGTTLNPWVRDAVQAELGAQVEVGIDPVTVVARGAAIFASMQPRPAVRPDKATKGTWPIQIEHQPVGNVPDPDVGGRVLPPDDATAEGCTLELVDIKTGWRTGRITLGPDGVFFTQLYAEKHQRHEFEIELCDPTGNRIPTSPDRIPFTFGGILPEKTPPAPMTIGIGLADGTMRKYIEKGTKLPARVPHDHYTSVALRAGHEEDELRIPLLEGEHRRAIRNHGIGSMSIRGTDIRSDLPLGSQVEITLFMDASQQVRLQAYVKRLDLDFEVSFDPLMEHDSLEKLTTEAARQKQRLREVEEPARSSGAKKATVALLRIENEELLEHVDVLIEAAGSDPDAVAELDRRLRELAATIDEIEDQLEWPDLVQKAEEARDDAENLVSEHGNSTERSRLQSLRTELEHAINVGDADLVRQYTDELRQLWVVILNRDPSFHVHRFDYLVEQRDKMRDPERADRVIAQGRRAISNNDVEALKGANRQLIALIPRELRQDPSLADERVGDLY